MTVLSLCDGMSCGQIALEKAGIPVKKYYASEIKKIGIKVTKENYPNTIHVGDLNKISYKEGVLSTEIGEFKENFDLVIFGSPCQSFSIGMKTEMRIGLEDKERSGLFLECYRILKEINPTYFFMENVASMKKDDKDFISKLLGVDCITLNSSLFTAHLRNRNYWTNIPFKPIIGDKGVLLQNILENGYTDREKARCLLASDSRPLATPVKMFHRYYSTGFTNLIFKDKDHYDACCKEYISLSGGKRKCQASDLDGYKGNVFDGVRYFTQEETEKLQSIPPGYTKVLTRNECADVCGDGWTVDVIAHMFKGLQK